MLYISAVFASKMLLTTGLRQAECEGDGTRGLFCRPDVRATERVGYSAGLRRAKREGAEAHEALQPIRTVGPWRDGPAASLVVEADEGLVAHAEPALHEARRDVGPKVRKLLEKRALHVAHVAVPAVRQVELA